MEQYQAFFILLQTGLVVVLFGAFFSRQVQKNKANTSSKTSDEGAKLQFVDPRIQTLRKEIQEYNTAPLNNEKVERKFKNSPSAEIQQKLNKQEITEEASATALLQVHPLPLLEDDSPQEFITDVETPMSISANGEQDRKLKDFQHTLDMICQSSMDPVVIIDEAGKIKSVNQEFLELFGYDLWEVVGKNVKILMPQEYAVNHNKYLERYRITKMRRIIGQVRTDIHGLKKNGCKFSIKLKVQVITDIHGVVYTGVIKDVGRDEELIKIRNTLSHMLPKGYEEKITTGKMIAENFPNGSVLFVDLVNFTKFASAADPLLIVKTLNDIFEKFDTIIKPMDVEKIKTIGDCYMAAAGVTKTMYDGAIQAIEAALQMIQCMLADDRFSVRAGVASGKIISGVLKGDKLSFDIWGDTVNVAARMQSLAPVDGLRVCKNTYQQSKFMYDFESSEALDVKGKGVLRTFVVKGRKQAPILLSTRV